jgi:hypothetical protein
MNVDHLLKQTCTISTAGAQDRFGKNAHSAPVTYACRFQKTNRIMQLPNGEQAPVDGLVWLAKADTVVIDDKLTFGGIDYRVMEISPMIDRTGATRHFELMVRKWST